MSTERKKLRLALDPARAKIVYDDINRTVAARALLVALKAMVAHYTTHDRIVCGGCDTCNARAAIAQAEAAGIGEK